jgi:hypothetical protein
LLENSVLFANFDPKEADDDDDDVEQALTRGVVT